MGQKTSISWCDHTFNPWHGCTEVSSGCDNCYARTLNKRWGGSNWGKGAPRKVMSQHYWNEPLKWNRMAEQEGKLHKVFCASMADVMDDEAPAGERERLWELIDKTPYLIWQLLTKRPQRYERYLPAKFENGNVWLGITAENQENYNLRWPILAKQCDVHDLISWISYEPALGPLTLTDFPIWPRWVIFGGESGAGHREADPEWARALIREIKEFVPGYVKFFVKQMSAATPTIGKALIPSDLRIQEFPA